MRVPFIRFRKIRGAKDRNSVPIGAYDGGPPVGNPATADQGAMAPLPRRQPGTHGAKAVKADPAAADRDALQKVIDGLNRM